MRMPWRPLGLLCGVLLAASLRAADEPVDPDFLEFLGSVDSNDIGWHDYLATTDVDAVVQKQGGAPQGADSPPPPAEPSRPER